MLNEVKGESEGERRNERDEGGDGVKNKQKKLCTCVRLEIK